MTNDKSIAMARINIFFSLIVLCACSTNHQEGTTDGINVSFQYDGKVVRMEADTSHVHHYTIECASQPFVHGDYRGVYEIDIPEVLRSQSSDTQMDFALILAKHGGVVDMHLTIDNQLDTVFAFLQDMKTVAACDDVSFFGPGARLIPAMADSEIDVELRRWLFRKGDRVEDSTFVRFREIYRALSSAGKNEFVVKGDIPVVHDLDGVRYRVTGNVESDYYAVVACEGQGFIDQIVEELVGDDFQDARTSLSAPFTCHYDKGRSGYKTIFLLCIDRDWTYRQIPLAVIALDNAAPEIGSGILPDQWWLVYKDNMVVTLPNDKPEIWGTSDVSVVNWDGNGLECNVTFRVDMGGDTKSVTIQRKGNLCCPEPYGGYYFKPENKVILAKDYEMPYEFTYKMHFDSGDNPIPFIVEDYHGNKREGSVVVNAKFVRSDTPSITIDNNIYNY